MNPWQAASAAIDAAFAEPVTYEGAGLPAPTVLSVIWTNEPAPAFQGAGSTARTVSIEVQVADLPERPGRGDVVTRGDAAWRPADVEDLDELGKYLITLERL